jgi:uncharacterized protein YjbJ (UPF0337 family)
MPTPNERETAPVIPANVSAADSPAQPAPRPAPVALRARSLTGTDEIKGRWKQRLGAARIIWARISEDELLQLEGHEQKLSGLIQERYAITRDEAVAQVRAFFNKHLS